jgi:hypothetical protein
MIRRLLPYEHQLIRELGITEAEYFEFIAYQQHAADCKDGTIFDVKNETALVLAIISIVGTIASTVAALLAPRPQAPTLTRPGASTQSRDQVFAPRFGFNAFQEVAKYGDPVNLIYGSTADNPTGGVRVKTSLLWSAVLSMGSSQYMQLLTMIGASELEEIDFTRTAIDQLPVRTISSSVWQFYRANGGRMIYDNKEDIYLTYKRTGNISSGSPTISNIVTTGMSAGDIITSGNFPAGTTVQSTTSSTVTCSANANTTKTNAEITFESLQQQQLRYEPLRKMLPRSKANTMVRYPYDVVVNPSADTLEGAVAFGFSQAYSPVNNKAFGVVEPVPLNTYVYIRNSTGDFKSVDLGVYLVPDDTTSSLDTYWPTQAGAAPSKFPKNFICRLKISKKSEVYPNGPNTGEDIWKPLEAANNYRQTYAQNIDIASTWKIGTAIFKTLEITGDDTLETGDMYVRIQCIRDGFCPTAPNTLQERAIYGTDSQNNLLKDLELAQQERREAVSQRANSPKPVNTNDRNDPKNTDAMQQWFKFNDEVIQRNAQIQTIRNQISDSNKQKNLAYYTKCLAKIEQASYETISYPDVIEFALRVKTFRRISGRANKYGGEGVTQVGFDELQNGIRFRTAMFKLYYKRDIGSDAEYEQFPGVFAVRRSATNDNYVSFKLRLPQGTKEPYESASDRVQWSFRIEPVTDITAECRIDSAASSDNLNSTKIYYLENSGTYQRRTLPDAHKNMDMHLYWVGEAKLTVDGYLPYNDSPTGTNEWDLFNLATDTNTEFSFEGAPEFTVTAVTEQRIDFDVPDDSYGNTFPYYKNIALLGFNAYSGKSLQELRAISVYVTKCKKVRRLNADGTYSGVVAATAYAPEIFLDTITDKVNGIGRYTRPEAVDFPTLGEATEFCRQNQLYFDGIIAEPRNWREFWTEVAPMSLLELARIDGRETLIPSVPFNATTKKIDPTAFAVTCMFTAGNILEDSYKEEFMDYGTQTRDIIAEIIYRDTQADDGFPRNRSITLQRKDANETDAIRQTFDLSSYVTTERQAILFGKLITNLRAHVRKAVEFQTFPSEAPVKPGDLVYVDTGHTTWDSVFTGSINSDGSLNMPLTSQIKTGDYKILLYKPSNSVRAPMTVRVENNGATVYPYNIPGQPNTPNTNDNLSKYEGELFVLGLANTTKRVFRIVEVSIGEEAEITLKALEYPVANNKALIAEGMTAADWDAYHEWS